MLPGPGRNTSQRMQERALQDAENDAVQYFGQGQYGTIYFKNSDNLAWYFRIPHESIAAKSLDNNFISATIKYKADAAHGARRMKNVTLRNTAGKVSPDRRRRRSRRSR